MFLSWLRCSLIFMALTGITLPSWALTLGEALTRARDTDPQYLSAQAALAGARERASQAFGALLPQISASANTTANTRNYEVLDSNVPTMRDRYNSNGRQIQLTQPLWRRANNIASDQADDSALQTEYQLVAAEQDLLVRLAQAWFDLMLARDSIIFYAGQVAATQHQWEQSRRGSELGLTSGPALEEARTKYDQALADYAVAESEKNIKLAELEQIVGPIGDLAPPSLADDFQPKDPRTMSLEQWLTHTESRNPAILAAMHAMEAASKEIRKQRAGHQPTLDAVATYGRNVQNAGSYPGQGGTDVKQGSLALQLNIPIFSGGTQSAKVREAMAMRDKAAQDLEAARRTVRLTSKQAWFTWQSATVRQKAAMQAVKFASTQLQSAIKGKSIGSKMDLDILQAQQQLYSGLRDLQRARYDLIINYLKLQATHGSLVDDDLISIDPFFIKPQPDPYDKLSLRGALPAIQ